MKRYFYLLIIVLLFSCGQSPKNNHTESPVAAEQSMDYDEGIAQESPMIASERAIDVSESMKINSKDTRVSLNVDSDYLLTDVFSSLAAQQNAFPDTLMQLIRTANIRFRVDNVVKATLDIESIIRKSGGYVEDTKLVNNIYSTQKMQITKDTILEISRSSLKNDFTLRIPSNNLDETLLKLVPLIEHLDIRYINVNDVSIEILAKHLEQARIAKYSKRMENAIDNKGVKLNDVTSAENTLLNRQKQADEAKIADLYLRKQIAYSTVHLAIYQNNAVSYSRSVIELDIERYTPSFGQRFTNAVAAGFSVLLSFMLFIVEIWWLWLILVLVYVIYKRYIKRKKE